MTELLNAEQVGRMIRPDNPMSASTVRKLLCRKGITEKRGYPADEIDALLRDRSADRTDVAL